MFDAKLVEFELTLSDPVHEFDAGDGRRGSSKMLEAEHRTKPQLDRSMVLFNQIVDVFGRPDLALISLGMFAESLCRPAMRRLIAVERDLVWQLALALERPSEERLGGGDVPLGAKQEIDGVSLFVDSAVKIGPAASDFDVGLIDAPGPPSWASEAVPALLELRHIALDPAHDRRMRQGEPAFGHHLGEISKAELVSQIPAHAEHDDLLVKVPALEESVHFRLRSSALSFDRFANDYAVSKQFAPEPFRLAFRRQGRLPLKITLDGYQASHRAAKEALDEHPEGNQCKIRSSKYLNNLIEQDHRSVKFRLGPMLGLKHFRQAATTIAGIELMHRIRKGQCKLGRLGAKGNTVPKIWNAVLAA